MRPNDRQRVLLLAESLVVGGKERQLTLLARYLPREWDRRVWSLDDGPFAAVLRAAGVAVDVRRRRYRQDVTPLFDLFWLLRRWRPSVVHSWSGLTSVMVALLCPILRIPWVDGSIRKGSVGTKQVARSRVAMALADRVLSNTRAGLEAWGVPSGKGRVVYNGFDPERLPLATRTAAPNGPFTVAMVGRMCVAKDFESFLSAAETLARDSPAGWHFVALGSGPLRSQLIDRASDLVRSGVVSVPDAGLEVIPYLRDADAGVLMSNPNEHLEGFSNAIMEYMACGLPVVCSDGGGNRELVADTETGFVIPPFDAPALATKLSWLRNNREVAARMGSAGRERLLRDFTVEEFVRRTVAVYEEILPVV